MPTNFRWYKIKKIDDIVRFDRIVTPAVPRRCNQYTILFDLTRTNYSYVFPKTMARALSKPMFVRRTGLLFYHFLKHTCQRANAAQLLLELYPEFRVELSNVLLKLAKDKLL